MRKQTLNQKAELTVSNPTKYFTSNAVTRGLLLDVMVNNICNQLTVASLHLTFN